MVSGLHFANGVAVDPRGQYVLFVETGRYRVLRYWLAGPRQGETQTFLENLPGIPNGIALRPAFRQASTSATVQYWLGFTTRRNTTLDTLHPSPFWKHALFSLPTSFLPAAEPYGLVMLVAADAHGTPGQVVRSFHDPAGTRVREAASVEEHDGFLYLGGDYTNAVLKFALPADLQTDTR